MTTAVLVHGGWHSASCWDLVRAELAADGIRSVAPQLPMTSTLDVDAAVVRETLDRLDAHLDAAGHSFKGIRHNVAWDRHPDTNNALRGAPEFALLDPAFQAGTAEVAKRGLVFETWLYFNQLSDMKKLARAQPDLRLILNHLGGPACNGPYAADRPGMLAQWRRNLADLAEAPNVYLKIGGIGYKSFVEQSVLDGPRSSAFLAEYWKPEIRFAIETFGPGRSMFETNYPEDGHLTDYVVLWNTYKRITADLSPDERSAVFEKTAASVYSLA